MKTSGFRCETKFGLLVFLGHPSAGDHLIIEEKMFWIDHDFFLNILAVVNGFQCNKYNSNVLNHVSWLKTLPNSDGKSFLNFSAKNVLLAKQLLQCLSFKFSNILIM